MEIILAESAGFCFGVKRAVEKVYEQTGSTKKIYTFGPIIHNEEVVKDLENKGVSVIETSEELNALTEGTVVIRSHGVSKNICDLIEKRGLECIDATCPFVKRIHNIVEKESAAGKKIIIIGNAGHPEVEGIKGWSHTPAVVIESAEEAEKFCCDKQEFLCIVSQTTFNYNKFKELVEIFQKKGYNVTVVNTICNATEERQTQARDIAARVDAMIVIGGKHSSNTRKLYEICKEKCAATYFIQTLDDLHLELPKTAALVGITAGASTPNNIIEEVQNFMSELTFEQMLEESLKTIHTGEVVEGTVIDVKPEEIILNIGYKSDGILTKNEYTNEPGVDLTAVAKPGDTMEVKVLKVNDGEGQVLLTYKRLAADRGNKRIEEAFNNKEVLTAKVSQVLEGGLSVVMEEVRIFIPASLVSDVYEKDLSKYAGQEIQFVISEYNPKRRRYIGDRRQLLAAEKAEKQQKLLESINIGDVVEGTVKNVTDFGAFIDIGGADGLLHISEMSWGRVENPKKVFKVGDQVKTFIKDISGTKIALSLKFEDANPWKDAAAKYAVGNEVTGKVARMTDFGAFVELEAGVDALLHVSQISREHIEKPADVLKIGEEVTAKVVDFNEEDKKISLSIKALLAPEPQEAVEETVEEDADVVSVDIDAVIASEEQ